MSLSIFLALFLPTMIWLALTAPPAPVGELAHLRACREDGWIFEHELRRLEALEHG